jgi:prephenate dehydrogenase
MDEKTKTITKWLENEVKGKRWDNYFESYGYKHLVVYGAGDLGKYLIWSLRGTNIAIDCVLDQRADEIETFENIAVYTLEEFLEKNRKTDAIVVTVINAYDEVLKLVADKRTELPVMSLRDMVYEM